MRQATLALAISGGAPGDRSFLRRYLPTAWRLLRSPPAQLSVALVGDRTMAALHERFLGIAGSTDVLTFELERADSHRITHGEIVICAPFARRAAKANGVPYRHELLLYAIHGMLHLSGYDDRTGRGFERMHATEDRILSRLGIGPVFAPKKRPRKTHR